MKILIVEDEPKIARAIKRGFEQERSVAEVVSDGESALASVRGDSYDVIILDRMLPGGMDGVKICEELRRLGDKTPIIMLTAKGQIRDRVEGLNSGADDYLVKPFSFDELLARVRALMRRPSDVQSDKLELDDLVIDTNNYVVTRAGKTIKLSQTEYALLEYLVRHKDQVKTKQELISQVWDVDADVLENTVEAYISYLRNKIDKPFSGSRKLIETVHGYGYTIRSGDER